MSRRRAARRVVLAESEVSYSGGTFCPIGGELHHQVGQRRPVGRMSHRGMRASYAASRDDIGARALPLPRAWCPTRKRIALSTRFWSQKSRAVPGTPGLQIRLDATDAAGQVHSIAPLDVFGRVLVNYTLYKLDSYVFQSAGGGQGASSE